jgi:uncharacterized protein YcbX
MRVGGLFSYPVKGCYRVEHRQAQVQPWGLAGDRRFMILDDDGLHITQRQNTGLVNIKPHYRDGRLVLTAAGHPDLAVTPTVLETIDAKVHHTPVRVSLTSPEADAWLTVVLDQKARLAWLDDPTRRASAWGEPDDRVSLADDNPLLLANSASLNMFNDWLIEDGSDPIPMTRFRPNVIVDGAAAWAEDEWVGRRFRVGDVWFRGAGMCGRCVVTTTDQETGARSREPLRMLGRRRNIDQGLMFGLWLIPDTTGTLRVGDQLVI